MGCSSPVSSLVADLVGATLVDAQDELWTAWRALEGLSDRERALAWLLEPPPWPPASVSKYLGRDGERAIDADRNALGGSRPGGAGASLAEEELAFTGEGCRYDVSFRVDPGGGRTALPRAEVSRVAS